ncbi:phage protease [Paracoccus sp. DMF-8]|uniref:phage protease n=1 Tax=Paracoccus sp. DMF-8 TaxID=3019445 RepID=UPI0023E80F4D|nr:phage protease [Paracoccus sp. DMF-8]MDF3606235.1 phage protease [Paracoccus sp. DMF-8]
MDLVSSWCAESELPAASAAGQWVHLLPAGRFQGRDGRSFVLNNPQGVIAESLNRGDLPVDYNHQIDDPEVRPASGDVRAAGWIKQVEARESGIWGLGRVGPKRRAMRSWPANIAHQPGDEPLPDGRIVRIIGAGLVHRPISDAQGPSSEQPGAGPSQVAAALGLPAEADTAAILTAVNALRTSDPA